MTFLPTPRIGDNCKALRLRIETEDPIFYGMKKLKMRGKDLENIPSAVFQLQELEVLDLSPERQSCLQFRLYEVPTSIRKLANLRALVLDTNDLSEIPEEVTQLKHLEKLALSNNRLTRLPKGFDKLQNLQSLHMANNEFEEFPRDICCLKNLEFLDLCDNEISEIPQEIKDLPQLHTLLLFYNKLENIPECICNMSELRCLWLGNNLIKQLPNNFGKLRNLDWGERYTSSVLEGNPLVHPPIEICRMGPYAIEKYMNSSKTNGRKMVVGK